MRRYLMLLLLLLQCCALSFSQQVNPTQAYPKIVGYTSILHPIVSFDKNGSTFNFIDSYTVGIPVGINILKSDKIGFTFELVPYIKAGDGPDRVSNFLFHPGVMFRYKHGFTFLTRVAFETSGRYGFTPVFNKILIKGKNVNFLTALSVPFRFGADKLPTVGLGLQFGISF
jgi:hypothetical protein